MIRNVYAVNMTIKANTVNIKEATKETGAYHHGDLRSRGLGPRHGAH